MPITKLGTKVTVTAESGKGDSWANPYSLDDILAASDTGVWGMTKQYDTYFIPFTIWIDADTYFYCYIAGRTIGVIFTGAVRDDVYSYYSDLTSHTRIGNDQAYNDQYGVFWRNHPEIPTGNRRTYFGGDVQIANLSLFLSHYTYLWGTEDHQAVMKNSTLIDLNFAVIANSYAELYNVQRNEGSYGFWVSGEPVYENCTLINANIGILATAAYQKFKGLKIINAELWDTYLRAAAGDKVLDLVDCEVTKAKLWFYNSGTSTSLSEQFLLTTSTIKVTDIDGTPLSGVAVSVLSINGTLLFSGTTDIDGLIDSEEIEYFYKWRLASGASGTLDEGETDHEPLSVQISKAEYDPVELKDIYVTPGIPTILRATLLAENPEASGLTNAYESEALRHLFLNEPILNIGDAGGLLPSASPGNFYIALLTESPGEAGSIDSEVAYIGYTRVAVPRTATGWTEFLGTVRNYNQVNFGESGGGDVTISHYAVMKEATGSEMVAYGALVDPTLIYLTAQPQFAPSQIEFNID